MDRESASKNSKITKNRISLQIRFPDPQNGDNNNNNTKKQKRTLIQRERGYIIISRLYNNSNIDKLYRE